MRDKVESIRGIAAAVAAARRRVIYALISRTRISSSRSRCKDLRTRTTRELPKSCRAFEVYRNLPSEPSSKSRASLSSYLAHAGSALLEVHPVVVLVAFYFSLSSFFSQRMTKRAVGSGAVTKLNRRCFYPLFARVRTFSFCSSSDSRFATGNPVVQCTTLINRRSRRASTWLREST